MKKFLLIITLFLNQQLCSQYSIITESFINNHYKISVNITPEKYSIVEDGNKKLIQFSNHLNEARPGEFILPQKDLFIAIPFNSDPQITVTIVKSNNIQAIPKFNPEVSLDKNNILNYTEVNEFNGNLEEKFYEIKGFLWIENNYCAHISLKNFLFDHYKRNTVEINEISLDIIFKKSSGFNSQSLSGEVNNIILNKSFAKKVQQKPVYEINNSDSWIDFTKTYLKIGTAKDAIYKLTQTDLQEAGINTFGINPESFKLINNGNEIPIYVEGETDGTFDSNDFIEFVGIRNMGGKHREVNSFEEPYNEYLGRYTDTTIYWLTWGGEKGSRVAVSNGISSLIPLDTLKFYAEIIHLEINNWFDFSMQSQVKREFPFWVGNKTWVEGDMGVGTRNISFTASDIYPDKSFKIFTKVQSNATNITQNAHLLSLKINSDPAAYDSGYIDKYQQKVLSGGSNSNFLINGNNSLKINSYATAAAINTCRIDWYEIEYPRYIKAVNGSLNFFFPFLNSELLRAVKISNLNSNSFSLWKYGEKYKKYFLTKAGSEIVFNDTINAVDKFAFNESEQISKPIIFYKKEFKNLRGPENTADYLAITHRKFLPKTEEYLQFVSSHYNLKSMLIDIDDIYDEFAYGYFNPESIKEFLKSTHINWQQPLPRYVFLIGAATYDYHGNKTKFMGEPKTYNYVPSFGASVSDNWFVTWDSTGAYVPRMNIGRLPVNSIDELNRYFVKHSSYVQQDYNEWNKSFLFFSGGNGDNQTELDQLRNVNQFIINNYSAPAPLGGINKHFYKTISPKTNFGPYSPGEIQDAIKNGGIFISYIGHSGTQTWDNSITDPLQLKNSKNKYSLITDFGCSTARFAEPDVVSFSQLFVVSDRGQAISYIGNSSLGFVSTSTTVPQIFYRKLLQDSVYRISEALKQAKLELISKFGSSEINQLFALTNSLIGDPVMSLPIPSKPDLSISNAGISFIPAVLSDILDSIFVRIKYSNFGLATDDSIKINIEDNFHDSTLFSSVVIRKIPLLEDSVFIKIPLAGKAGEHKIHIKLDSEDVIDEISEDNNETIFNFNVASSSIRNDLLYLNENKADSSIVLLNPSIKPLEELIECQIADNIDFNSAVTITLPLDSFYTKLNLSSLDYGRRYWLKSKIKNENSFGIEKSFVRDSQVGYLLNDSISFSGVSGKNVKYSRGSVALDTSEIKLSALSAGFNDGNSAVISVNDQNLIPENTLRGHHVCLFKKNTLEYISYRRFDLLGGGTATADYINFIDTLSGDYLVLIAVSDEGRVSSSPLRNKIKEFGSAYIDSLPFRGSWAMIGMKGAQPGSVPEAYSIPYGGRVQIDTTFLLASTNGSLLTSKIGPAGKWENLNIRYNAAQNSEIKVKPLAITLDSVVDTLDYLILVDSLIDISSVNAVQYPFIRLLVEFNKEDTGDSPQLDMISARYNSVPELGLNYQVVSIPGDTIYQGDDLALNFYVYNVGGSPADSFNFKVEVIKPDNSVRTLKDSIITQLESFQKNYFSVTYNNIASDGKGSFSFRISIDPENKIPELYKDNNVFEIPFYVKPDTNVTSVSSATMNATFDGNDIMDGDFISGTPEIVMILNYPSWFPAADTSAVEFFLDQQRIYFGSLNVEYDTANRNIIYTYKPALKDGEHTFRIYGMNVHGVMESSPGYQKMFMVSNQAQLIDAYNYPNPFKENTYFTFRLTQIPDELRVKIYTIAGRLIKEIIKPGNELSLNFNSIFWDGKDEDGDDIANGVYLCKFVLRRGNEVRDVTQKAARIR